MTAYDRYRPAVVPGTTRAEVICNDCCTEGWPGRVIWTAPEGARVDLADMIRAADAHEREFHPLGCRCDPYDCNHDEED